MAVRQANASAPAGLRASSASSASTRAIGGRVAAGFLLQVLVSLRFAREQRQDRRASAICFFVLARKLLQQFVHACRGLGRAELARQQFGFELIQEVVEAGAQGGWLTALHRCGAAQMPPEFGIETPVARLNRQLQLRKRRVAAPLR